MPQNVQLQTHFNKCLSTIVARMKHIKDMISISDCVCVKHLPWNSWVQGNRIHGRDFNCI